MQRKLFAVTVALGVAGVGALGIAVLSSCLRPDDRPTPGMLTLTVSPSPAVTDGVTTADGWRITFDRVLVAMGKSGLGDTCSIYGEADYDRILDVTHVGNQKLGILYGIGQCDIDFRIDAPSPDAILSGGATEDDKTRMRTPGGDAYVPLGGVSAEITVTATRGADTKQFRLSFRSRVRYRDCTLVADSGVPAVDLEGNVALTYDLRVEAESFLRDDVDAASPLRFDPFAKADTNADGVVTLDELRAVPIETVRDGGAFEAGTYELDEAGVVQNGKPVVIATLGDYVYRVLVPTLVRFRDTGRCLPTFRRPD